MPFRTILSLVTNLSWQCKKKGGIIIKGYRFINQIDDPSTFNSSICSLSNLQVSNWLRFIKVYDLGGRGGCNPKTSQRFLIWPKITHPCLNSVKLLFKKYYCNWLIESYIKANFLLLIAQFGSKIFLYIYIFYKSTQSKHFHSPHSDRDKLFKARLS